MEYPISLIAVTVIAFAATNLDNLLLLVSWLLLPEKNAKSVAAGLALGTSLVIAVSYLISWVTSEFATGLSAYFSYLGVIPLLLGAQKLSVAWRSNTVQTTAAAPTSGNQVLAYASTQLANSGDTVAVFAPLLIDTKLQYHWLLGLVVASCAAGLLLSARWLANHARRIPALARYAELLSAAVMIGIGLFILADTATDISL